MRMMLKVMVPNDGGNAAVKNGSIGKIIGQWSELHKPEAAYFAAEGGDRCAYFVFDMKDPSDMPSVAEPFFQGLNARIEARPVMNQQELKAGIEKLEKLKL
jgi:hypothetical protein